QTSIETAILTQMLLLQPISAPNPHHAKSITYEAMFDTRSDATVQLGLEDRGANSEGSLIHDRKSLGCEVSSVSGAQGSVGAVEPPPRAP
ncbi:MAG: hypothetical protein KGJ57_15315, partial [Sphingomonadales bacterium]|nr:hypothetical protein [Sphingomonadales bacterium]